MSKGVPKTSRPQFDIDALHQLAGDKVFARGVNYYENGQVEIVAIEKTRIFAWVSGSEIYRVVLKGKATKFSGECSCPAFEDWGFCKHLVATALAANNIEPDVLNAAINRCEAIRAHLRTTNIDELVEMIIERAERDPALFEELELAAAKAVAAD
jgi:uncharacterized Zn finger protein